MAIPSLQIGSCSYKENYSSRVHVVDHINLLIYSSVYREGSCPESSRTQHIAYVCNSVVDLLPAQTAYRRATPVVMNYSQTVYKIQPE